MASRNLLHKDRLLEFIKWLDENKIPNRIGKGEWEVRQIYLDGEWHKLYARANMPEHLTVQTKLIELVRKFIYDTRAIKDGNKDYLYD